MKARRHTWALVLLLALVSACGCRGDDTQPSVKILSPRDQHATVLGETLEVESRVRDDNRISQVELRINGIQVDLYDVPEGEKSFRAKQSWLPPDAGTYHVAVIAYDDKGQESEPAAITINVQSVPKPIAEIPSPTPPPLTSTPGQASPTPSSCTHNAVFVADVTIPDNTQLAPGTEFVKTWRLRNSGTCDWGSGFQFVFAKGEQMGGPTSVNVPPTPAGSLVDISVTLQAPQKPGTYRGYWRTRAPDGRDFGDRPFVQIVVPRSVTPSPLTTPTATAVAKPDLDIILVPGNLELSVNQPMALDLTVRNHGPGATHQPALVRATFGTALELGSSVPSLPSGAQEVALLSHTFDEPVDLEILITVDPGDEIAEGNETNNAERVILVVNPPLYTTCSITATPSLSFDLDDGADEVDKADIEWRVVEGTVYLGLLNGAGAALLGGAADSVSYTLTAGLIWETEQLALIDLADGSLFGFRTSEGRVGYARVEAVLDTTRTGAQLTYLIWDWP